MYPARPIAVLVDGFLGCLATQLACGLWVSINGTQGLLCCTKAAYQACLGDYVVSRAESEVRDYATAMAKKLAGYVVDDRSEPDRPMGALEFAAPQVETLTNEWTVYTAMQQNWKTTLL